MSRPTTIDCAAQMTIFYGGMVNVYDEVSIEKARVVMLLAESPNFIPHVIGTPHPSAFPSRRSRMPSSPPPTTLAPSSASSPADGPKTRKESVQRFLEKRKERGRLKAGNSRPKSTAGLEGYLAQPIHDSTRNTGCGTEDTCLPPNPVPPSTPNRTWSFRSQPGLSGDINNDDEFQEIGT